MRVFKLCLLLGMLLAFSGAAHATSIPFRESYQGPVFSHLANFDSSVLYGWNGGFLADGTTPIVIGTAYPASQVAQLQGPTIGNGLIGNEDAWGVFRIDNIYKAAVTGPDQITQDPSPPNLLYQDGDTDHTGRQVEVVGIFYGRQDISVTFLTPGDLGLQLIYSTGGTTEIFLQDYTTYDNGVGGSASRVDQNEYLTIGYDGSGTDTLLSHASQVLSLADQPGFFQDSTAGFNSLFAPNGAGSGSGQFDTFLSVVGGDEAFYWDSDGFPNGGSAVTGVTADFRLKGTTTPTGVADWLVSSSDPLTAAFVPEPLTLMGVMTGVSLLGGYIRRRRRA